MKNNTYMSVFFLIFVILSCIGDLGSSSSTNSPKTINNNNPGYITLFSQNYSGANNIPKNIFIAKIESTTTFDNVYSKIYGKEKSEILLENSSKGLRFTTARNSPLIPYNLLSYADTIASCGIIRWVEYLIKPVKMVAFCNDASVPLVDFREEQKLSRALYICGLTPMVKCTYEVSIDINTDDQRSFVELDSPGSKLIIQKIDNNTVLKSYYQTDSENMESKTMTIGNANISNFKIVFDGENKTNTIITENGSCIVTPFYDLERQKLPYIDFSNGYIKFVSFIMGKGTFLDVNIFSINQKAERKFITPIGYSKMISFGLDGPSPRNETGIGINYLINKGDRGTIWFDVEDIGECNKTDLDYLRYLVTNDSWETGIHFSKELNNLPLEEAYKTMDAEYEYVYEKIGKKPTSWCSLRNNDGIKNAIYAYNKYGMYWRNGDSGVEAETMVGNLYDDTWKWWEPASYAGMTHPVFTHQLDKDPAIKYSISYSKFKTWVDNYYLNNISIVPFNEYSLISRNTHDAYFDNISSSGNITSFKAHTNGVKSYINVNITAGNDTQVYDRTLNESLRYTLEGDKSINFWAENNHTYEINLKWGRAT
jgi:hypothetical protein